MSDTVPKISFGIIVLNGEPFTRYCLRSLYPFAHQVIVVEGACESAKSIATKEGHSTDGTLEALYRFQREEDPEKKLQILTRDGFWSEKDEQSRAYAEVATGNYLWQVDIDEFYHPEQMKAILHFLQEHPQTSRVSFKQITFWGGFDTICDGWYLKRGAEIYHRLFRWGKGYRYVTHRPPTVQDQNGNDLSNLSPIVLKTYAGKSIFLYHYSLLFPKQVFEKCQYYQNVSWTDRKQAAEWAEDVFLNLKQPFRVHNVYQYPSWLQRFDGIHPPQIEALRKDLQSGKLDIKTRKTEDVELILGKLSYRLGRAILKFWGPLDQKFAPLLQRLKHVLKHPGSAFGKMKQKSAHWVKELF